jgi:hypothetical protein
MGTPVKAYAAQQIGNNQALHSFDTYRNNDEREGFPGDLVGGGTRYRSYELSM